MHVDKVKTDDQEMGSVNVMEGYQRSHDMKWSTGPCLIMNKSSDAKCFFTDDFLVLLRVLAVAMLTKPVLLNHL